MNQIEVLQVAIEPILYTAYAWLVVASIAIIVAITSKTIDSLREDWDAIQQRKNRAIIAAHSYRDLKRLAKQYGLVPTTQHYADLVAAIHNYHIQQQQRRYA